MLEFQLIPQFSLTKMAKNLLTKINIPSCLRRFGNDEWEIAPGKLVIVKKQKLGSGAFAIVYKGILKLLPPIAFRRFRQMSMKTTNEVAVKMPLETASNSRRSIL
jgi:hypothetical protein